MVYKGLTAEYIDSLGSGEATLEVKKLLKLVSEADRAYHTEDDPIITDAEYDTIKVDILHLAEKFPSALLEVKKVEGVGGELGSGFKKVKHVMPMLSLSNGRSKKDIYNFEKSIRSFLGLSCNDHIWFVSEPKIDGLSLALRYETVSYTHLRAHET